MVYCYEGVRPHTGHGPLVTPHHPETPSAGLMSIEAPTSYSSSCSQAVFLTFTRQEASSCAGRSEERGAGHDMSNRLSSPSPHQPRPGTGRNDFEHRDTGTGPADWDRDRDDM